MSVDAILNRLEQPRANVLDLLRLYRSHEETKVIWREDARLYRSFARRLVAAGHPTQAFELIREGLEHHRQDQDLEYLGALALKRGGNTQRAEIYTEKILARSDLRPEIRLEALSLAGSLLKEQYVRSARTLPDPALARRSAELYLAAYQLAGDENRFPSGYEQLFPGINAATMSFLGGDMASAKDLADAVLARASIEGERPENSQNHWVLATMGEALLLLGNLSDAAHLYLRAVEMAKSKGRDGDVEAMRRNFQLLRIKMPLNDAIWRFFNIGNVVVFSGHRIDQPVRPFQVDFSPRFPPDPALIERVEEEIDKQLKELNARVGYCSAACGADILFAERMLERKAELHVVLPFDLDDFYHTSVDYGARADDDIHGWRARCDRVIQMATQVHYATEEKYLGDDVLFSFMNTFLHGLAIIRAGERGVDPFALVVLDRRPALPQLPGGTADFLVKWSERGLESSVIELGELREDVGTLPGRPAQTEAKKPPAERIRRKTMVMLFADVKNFSKLDDFRYPDFFATFLDEVKQVLDAVEPPPTFVNTWGDGLYVVFERVVDGADFALRLVDRVNRVDWSRIGLPGDTTVRIGMHAGPVYQRMDPIIGRENVFGSQVNRAARIEPVTTPGCVFASEQFAAALAIESGHDFFCEYIGIEELAKGYDRCPLYVLGRR